MTKTGQQTAQVNFQCYWITLDSITNIHVALTMSSHPRPLVNKFADNKDTPAENRQECDLDLRSDGSSPEHPFSPEVKDELQCILDISKSGFLEKLLKNAVITRSQYDEVRRIAKVPKRRAKIIQLLYGNGDHNFRQRVTEVFRDPELSASHIAEYIEQNGVRPEGQNNWPFYAVDKSIDKLQEDLVNKLGDTSLDSLLHSLVTRGLLNKTQAKYITTEKPIDQIPALIEIVVCCSITELEQFAACLDQLHPELAELLKQTVIKPLRQSSESHTVTQTVV